VKEASAFGEDFITHSGTDIASRRLRLLDVPTDKAYFYPEGGRRLFEI